MIAFVLDGAPVEVADGDRSLLDVLRHELGRRSPKDGCSPQGQCGCCTVLVDGSPRVACVTPVRRIRGREVTTLEGLPEPTRARWAEAFCAAGGSQCGFCTPGIIVRLSSLDAAGADLADRPTVEKALKSHLCRCTGWNTIVDACRLVVGSSSGDNPGPPAARDLTAAVRRAGVEGRTAQRVGPEVALGLAGFAADSAPPDALVAIPDGRGDWVVAATLAEARTKVGKVQGRRTTIEPSPPLEVPPGPWTRTLRTNWVDPAYLETDASWCEPGGEPASPLANGGAFGAKRRSPVTEVARQLAARHGQAVLAMLAREDTVRLGAHRPPVAAGAASAEHGRVRVARCDGWAALGDLGYPVEAVDVPGPPVSLDLRVAGVAEILMLQHSFGSPSAPVHVGGASASAAVGEDGALLVSVSCGDPLDDVVLRSYCVGAAHMALSWVTSEGLAVAEDGEALDLTVRSFGVVPAAGTPPIVIEIEPSGGPPVNGSDAVFVAVAAAVWRHQGFPPVLPSGVPLRPWR